MDQQVRVPLGWRGRPSRGQSRRSSDRRRRWWCWERRRWHCDWGLRQSCSRTTTTHGHTAIIFLRLGPRVLNNRRTPEAGLAVERQRRGRARQQPAEQGDQQEQTKKATTCDDASEVPLGASEVAATSDVLVCRFLDVFSLASTNIRQGSVASAATASDTTSGAILARSNATSSAISCSAPTSGDEPPSRSCDDTAVAATCPGHAGSSGPTTR